MFENIIKSYINKITLNDIINYARKEGIILTNEEVKVIYGYIKNDWKTLIFGNPTNIFMEYKKKVSSATYQKTIELYNMYKSKYL